MLAEVNGVGPQSPFQQEDGQGQSTRIRGRARPRRIGTTVLFESSGGQGFNLPELRVALGEPEVDTTTIDKRHDSLGGVRVFHSQGRVGRLLGVTIATVQNPTLRSAGPEAIRQCPT